MGKRLSISQPTIIQTQLAPLTETFWLTTNSDSKEQWYYENTNLFSPNREISPLIITPHLSALDIDTNIVYEPNYSTMTWKVRYWNGTAWITETISETQDDPSHPYVKSGYNLIVHKNNPDPTHGITITCEAVYYDPRDAGMTYKVIESLELTTNKDATVLYPNIDVLTEPSIMYNPLRTGSSVFELKATADWSQVSDINENILQYKVDPLGTEAIVPSNDEDVETCSPKMDIRYGDHPVREDEQFMFRQVADGDYAGEQIDKAYIERMKGNTVVWNQKQKYYANFTEDMVTASGCSVSFSNGVLIASGGTATNKSFSLMGASDLPYVVGRKYYCVVNATATSSVTVYLSGGSGAFGTLRISDEFVRNRYIATNSYATGRNGFGFYLASPPSNWEVKIKYVSCIDLTLMFGAGSEPSTVEEFEAWLATNVGLKGYYPYNAGSLISVKTSAIKTIGFNQWDEEWELGYYDASGNPVASTELIRSKELIPVLPSTTYYFMRPSTSYRLCYYDANGDFLSRSEPLNTSGFTTDGNVYYINFHTDYSAITYNHDICINISDASKNGTYEAYREDNTSLPITTLKGKLNGSGSSVTIFPDGMKSLGSSVYDEIKVENGQLKAIKRVGSVDMGTLPWEISSALKYEYFTQPHLPNKLLAPKLSTAKYINKTSGDKRISFNTTNGGEYRVYDTAYCNTEGTEIIVPASTFKSDLSGVMLYYELETPQEYVLDPLPRGVFEWYAFINGQETLIENHPAYQETLQDVGKGQHTDTIKVDALYDENMHIMLRIKNFESDSEPLPPKVFRNIVWRIPKIDCIVHSNNGNTVRDSSNTFEFSTIVNIKGENLDDDVIENNLRFLWKWRNINMSQASAPVNTLGWGRKAELTKDQMLNTTQGGSIASTSMINEAYLVGAKEVVTINGEVVTYNGQKLYTRPV